MEEVLNITRNRFVKVETDYNKRIGDIEQSVDVMGRVHTWIAKTRDLQMREALIKLGWTPPEGKGNP